MKVLLLGGSGQLGAAFLADWPARHEVAAPRRTELDLASRSDVEEMIARRRPDVIVNAASYNDVERAEDDPITALTVNALAVSNLAESAKKRGATLVHFSSDFVFDGGAARPYREEDAPGPLSVYGMSKLLGERAAASAPRHYVLRVESLFGGPNPRSTVDRLAAALRNRDAVDGFTDRAVSPTPVPDLVRAVERMLLAHVPFGLYHAASRGFTTWFELATEIAKLLGRDGLVRPISTSQKVLRARRPAFAPLSAAKLESLGIAFPGWREAIGEAMRARFGETREDPARAVSHDRS